MVGWLPFLDHEIKFGRVFLIDRNCVRCDRDVLLVFPRTPNYFHIYMFIKFNKGKINGGGVQSTYFLCKRNRIIVGAFLKNNMVCMIILGQREIEKGGGMKYE
jgi:hypothetical protein